MDSERLDNVLEEDVVNEDSLNTNEELARAEAASTADEEFVTVE